MTRHPYLLPWPHLAALPARPITRGLIHQTWAVGAPPQAAVQRVSPLFHTGIHGAIEAVTKHLAQRSIATPLLVPTQVGDLFAHGDDGGVWRALTWVDGAAIDRVDSAERAAEVGRFVGQWHEALLDVVYDFRHMRTGVHDTPAHMARLRAAIDAYPDHRLASDAAPVAQAILAQWDAFVPGPPAPVLVCHGDLKINNVQFGADGRARALLDLDTVGPQPLDDELGDAWRSWANPAGEDDPSGTFDAELAAAAAEGYLDARPLSAAAREALVSAPERIALELAARFCRDALEESYFGWNPAVAPTRGEHNVLRARGQLAVARSAKAQRPALRRALGLGVGPSLTPTRSHTSR